MDHPASSIISSFYQYGGLLGLCSGLIWGLYVNKQYLRKLQLGLGIRVLAVILCITTRAVLGLVAGSVLAEVHAYYQESVPNQAAQG